MHHRFGVAVLFCAFLFPSSLPLSAQSPTATVNGQVRDTTGAVVPDADVQLISELTSAKYARRTNNEGIYSIVSIPPGTYRIQVSKVGFKTIIQPAITLNVLDARAINFELPVGAVSEIVTVESGTSLVNTESAAVSTVVDRQFAENLPMNGRSFQTLIDLTPGVVLTTSTMFDSGQFSVNGQRPSSNYFTVDGVSANFGVSPVGQLGNGAGGAAAGFSAQGGTNSLVSVDALQEFRIQTSTYAPEFGRTPGAQVSIATLSGTNQFHGSAFDYLRNDVLDANNWFNGINILNPTPLPKAEERQNDFGGTFSGPILRDRTFFFFSYEGLRLRLPQTGLSTVPDLGARESAPPAIQPFLNAFPFDPSQPDLGNGIAQFNSSFSDRSTLDAASLRIDHHLTNKLTAFARYNYSPSELFQRGAGNSLSSIQMSRVMIQTATGGIDWTISPLAVNDLRINYSRNNAQSSQATDNFRGATALVASAISLPTPYTFPNADFSFSIISLASGTVALGELQNYLQRQLNIVDSLSLQKGSHSLKFGLDFRRLSPVFEPPAYRQGVNFDAVSSAETGGTLDYSLVEGNVSASLLFHNLGIFAQDNWRVGSRLTITYGLRLDVDFAPTTSSGPHFASVTQVNNLSTMALAPAGTSVFATKFDNIAPRVGLAYQLSQTPGRETVLRGGFGVFYDLATQEVGEATVAAQFPFGAQAFNCCFTNTFPLDTAAATPPAISSASLTVPGNSLFAFDPHLDLPYTLQWNTAIEQSLGTQQSLSASYVGANGRRLIHTDLITQPNPTFSGVYIVTNGGTSDYDSLQVQFKRRLRSGLQALISYSLSHSIDDGSASSYGNYSNVFAPQQDASANRGPSDFDVRHSLSGAVSYQVPALRVHSPAAVALRGWSLQTIIQARSSLPVDVYCSGCGAYTNTLATIRPSYVPGVPVYLYGAQYPGGKAINVAAFALPPVGPTGQVLSQGDVGRNALRGFGATQWDFALHREFPFRERIKLQFRAEFFNLLNHPNFGSPQGDLGFYAPSTNPQFGLSTQMLANSLNGLQGSGLNPLYQIGGPRSIQFALKLTF